MKMCLNCALWFEAIDTMKSSSKSYVQEVIFWEKVAHPVNGFVQDSLQCDYYKQGHLDKVDQSDYRKITIHFLKVICQS